MPTVPTGATPDNLTSATYWQMGVRRDSVIDIKPGFTIKN